MFKHSFMKSNGEGHLELGKCDTVSLAKEYGTPLYVMDEKRICDNMRQYKDAIDKYYDGKGLCLYASKAFSAVYMYKLTMREGLGVDVVSGGELYTAIKAGFDTSKIIFHGNNKTYDEIVMAVINGVGRLVIDSREELAIIDEVSKTYSKKTKVLIRVKPGVDAHTHEFISTGQIDSKFGFAIENGEAMQLIEYALSFENIEITGLHCHIGSQMFMFEPFRLAAEKMMNFYADVKEKLNLSLGELNLGGGFGIKYTNDDTPVDYGGYIKSVSQTIKKICKEKNLEIPFMYMEPGRSIVGDAGITLYSVGSVKDIPGVRKYVSVDGGMGDNPRYILYQAEHDAVTANRVNDKADDVVTICGKCCESGDVLIENCKMPQLKAGDIIAVMSTGAYNYSMASNYNRIPRPPVVMVSDGKSKVIVKRESYDDIIKNDIL